MLSGVSCMQTLDNKIKEYEVERHALFFTDADSKRIYKENVKYTVLRKNSVNGRIYKDDPTIFSWGLLNEPRCETWKVCSCGAKGTLDAEMQSRISRLFPVVGRKEGDLLYNT